MNMDQLQAVAPVAPQWSGKYDVEDAVVDKIRDAVVQEGMLSLPPISLSLQDTTGLPDPYGNPRPNN
ncbi:MAG: hypothetical protein ACK559_30840, partial [bacterium]